MQAVRIAARDLPQDRQCELMLANSSDRTLATSVTHSKTTLSAAVPFVSNADDQRRERFR